MVKPFETRCEELNTRRAADAPKRRAFVSGAEYLREGRRVTSDERLSRLGSGASAALFAAATRELLEEGGFAVVVAANPTELPLLGDGVRYKYSSQYEDVVERVNGGKNIVAVAVKEVDRVIGYGIASVHEDCSNIEIIDVDVHSRRSAGLSREVAIESERFTVGVGHIVVDALIQQLGRPIHVDATHDDSRYVFRSLGFVNQPGQNNPCLMELV